MSDDQTTAALMRQNAELREQLAAVEAERDNAQWWSRNRHELLTEYRDILKTKNELIDSLLNNLTDKVSALEAERDAFRNNFKWWKSAAKNHRSELELERADHRLTKRILAALREPSKAVLDAAWMRVPLRVPEKADVAYTIRAAVTAAEKEVGDAAL